jgi:hypothetical protein
LEKYFFTTQGRAWPGRNQNRSDSRRDAKATTENDSFGAVAVFRCVMLNEVKHLLCVFPDSFYEGQKSQKQILRRYTPQNDTRE